MYFPDTQYIQKYIYPKIYSPCLPIYIWGLLLAVPHFANNLFVLNIKSMLIGYFLGICSRCRTPLIISCVYFFQCWTPLSKILTLRLVGMRVKLFGNKKRTKRWKLMLIIWPVEFGATHELINARGEKEMSQLLVEDISFLKESNWGM